MEESFIYSRPQNKEEIDTTISFLFDTIEESQSSYLSEKELDRDMLQKKAIMKERLESAAYDLDKYMGIVKNNATIIGAISARIIDDAAFIDFLYIDKKYRSRGIGPQLTKKCIAALYKRKKLHHIALQVYENNTKAIAKYEREGFKKIETKQKDTTVSWVMKRTIHWYEKWYITLQNFWYDSE